MTPPEQDPEQDAVDRIASQWQTVRPDLDSSPITVIGRFG